MSAGGRVLSATLTWEMGKWNPHDESKQVLHGKEAPKETSPGPYPEGRPLEDHQPHEAILDARNLAA